MRIEDYLNSGEEGPGCLFILGLISMFLFYSLLMGPCIKTLRSSLDSAEIKRGQPTIYELKDYNKIRASRNLANSFSLRGYDYDKDGLLDKVERYEHNWRGWGDLDRGDYYFDSLQEEYSEYLKRK